jgi:hypothetical protein
MTSKRAERTVRITRLGKKLANHWQKLRLASGKGRVPFARKARKIRAREYVAYDLETTRIKTGTPEPRYITAFGESFFVSKRIDSLRDLLLIIEERFLTLENNNCRFVAWNGNGFDVYLIGAALLLSNRYELRPYLTRGKNLRGLRVTLKARYVPKHIYTKNKNEVKRMSWEFLDGISMTLGNAMMTLKKFLALFAPEFGKLEGPDFSREEFDAENESHRRYAERDSEGLYHAMQKIRSILIENFSADLQPTVGNMAIRIMQANLPEGFNMWEPSHKLSMIIRTQLMRGGYCHCMRKYKGAIWKYDINQAYAAAMRETWLPAGRCFHLRGKSKFATAAIYRIEASHASGTVIPFYSIDAKGIAQFSDRLISDTWITASELQQLERERWSIKIIEGYGWEDSFQMREYVNRLEALRMSAEGHLER